MKGKTSVKKNNLIRPSPNEEAAIVQNEQERRKKIRLKQVRQQEKAFAQKIRKNIKSKRENELKVLSDQLKEQWAEKQKLEVNKLEKKYQNNLEKLGDGHAAAKKDQGSFKKDHRILTKEDRQRAIERNNQAIYELSLERARNRKAESDRAAARAKAMEAEKARAAMVSSLPPTRDIIQEFVFKEEQILHLKNKEDFKSTRYHLQQPVQVERMSSEQQVDARIAAEEEENKMHVIKEQIQRSEAEQAEKARLRHKHALSQLKTEEDRKKLMYDLSQLERIDRQRRQDAVARIPVRIFQPPHKRLEDEEERQRDLEQAFEDMYMMQTGYTGDLTMALETSTDSMTIPEEFQPRVSDEQFKRSPAAVISNVPILRDEESVKDSQKVMGKSQDVTEKTKIGEEDGTKESPPAKGEDAVKRLLLRIQRQREQSKIIKDQTSTDEQTPQRPSTSRTTPRVTGSRVDILTPLPEEAEEELTVDEDTSGTIPPVSHAPTTSYQDIQRGTSDDTSQPARTLFHPYEEAQQVRTVGRREREDAAPSSDSDETMPESLASEEPERLEQQRLKLQLQEQKRIQERLEDQLNQYQKQFQKISREMSKGAKKELEGTPTTETRGAEPGVEEADSFDQIKVPVTRQEDRQREKILVAEGEISGESLEQGSITSRTSGTISLEEQTPEEEDSSESSKSILDYETAGPSESLQMRRSLDGSIAKMPRDPNTCVSSSDKRPGTLQPRGSLVVSRRRALEDQSPKVPHDYSTDVSSSDGGFGAFPPIGSLPITRRNSEESTQKMQYDQPVGMSSSDESLQIPSIDHNLQRGASMIHARAEAPGFLPLEWQNDNHVGAWEFPTYPASMLEGGPSRIKDINTTGDTIPDKSVTESEEQLESQDLASSSNSTGAIPHDRLVDLFERRNMMQFSQSESGSAPINDIMLSKSSSQSAKGVITPSSYSSELKLSASSSSLTQMHENVPPGTMKPIQRSSSGQTTSSYSWFIDGSPNYLDEYRRKWEEEKRLIENQRQLIRQKQEHQLRRMRYYRDILDRYDADSSPGLDIRPPISSSQEIGLTKEVSTCTSQNLLSDGFKTHQDLSAKITTLDSNYELGTTNKENKILHDDADMRFASLAFKGSSSSSDNSVLTRISFPWDSNSSSHSKKHFKTISKRQADLETKKSTSSSDFNFPSSGTDYHSLPISPEVSGNLGPEHGSRSSITTLSELTERMTKLTSSSENESGKDFPGRLRLGKVPDKANWAEYLSENQVPEYEQGAEHKHLWYESSLSSSIEDGTNGVRNSDRQWYMPAKPSIESLPSLGPIKEVDSPSFMNLDYLEGGGGFQPPLIFSTRSIGPVQYKDEGARKGDRNLENVDGGGGFQLPPRFSSGSIDTLSSENEDNRNLEHQDCSTNGGEKFNLPIGSTRSTRLSGTLESLHENVRPGYRNLENHDSGTHGEGIQIPSRHNDGSFGPVGPIKQETEQSTNFLEYRSPGTQVWYLPPKSSNQSMDSFEASSAVSSPNAGNLQLPDRSFQLNESRQLVKQWFVPPKSSHQSMGSPKAFIEGSSPKSSNLNHPGNIFGSLQRHGENWYLPIPSRDSERGESSPEHSLLLRQSVVKDVQKQTRTTSLGSTYAPTFEGRATGSRVMQGNSVESASINDSMDVPDSTRSEGSGARAERVLGDRFFSPSIKHQGNSQDVRASPASLSSGSLVSDISNKISSPSSEDQSTTGKSEASKKSTSDDDPSEESNNHSTETDRKHTTGSDTSQENASAHTEAMMEDDVSHSDIFLDVAGSNTTALQDAFLRRKQDFVKKSLARVERAKAKRFEVTPRVLVKKRVKPDKLDKSEKPVKSGIPAKISKNSQQIKTKECSSRGKKN